MAKRPSEDTEVSATRKQRLTLSMDPRMAEQIGHFRVTAGKPGTYSAHVLWLKNLCADFTSAHPGYTIYPVCLNGSAVETFFSQVKHVTSGQLSSLNCQRCSYN